MYLYSVNDDYYSSNDSFITAVVYIVRNLSM